MYRLKYIHRHGIPVAIFVVALLLSGCGKLNLKGRGEGIFKDIDTIAVDPIVEKEIFVPSQPQSLYQWDVSDFFAERGGVINHKFTGVFDVKKKIPLKGKSSYRKLWKEQKEYLPVDAVKYTGGKSIYLNSPIYFDNTILFLTKKGLLVARDVSNGYKVKWEFPLQFIMGKVIKKTDQASLSYGDDKVFITTNNGYIIALDANNGQFLWYKIKPFPIRSPLKYYLGKLYGSSPIGHFFVLDVDTGDELITNRTSPIPKITKIHPSILIGNSVAVAGYANGNINGFDLDRGFIRWALDLSQASQEGFMSMSDVDFTPIYIDGVIIGGSINGGIFLARESDGKTIWNKSISVSSQIIADGEFIFFIDTNNNLICMRRKDGGIKWATKMPSVLNIRIPKYLNDNQIIKALPVIKRGPILANGKLLVFTNFGEVITINPDNGNISNRFIIPYSITDPIIVDSKLYFMSYNLDKLIVMY